RSLCRSGSDLLHQPLGEVQFVGLNETRRIRSKADLGPARLQFHDFEFVLRLGAKQNWAAEILPGHDAYPGVLHRSEPGGIRRFAIGDLELLDLSLQRGWFFT